MKPEKQFPVLCSTVKKTARKISCQWGFQSDLFVLVAVKREFVQIAMRKEFSRP